MRGKRQEQVTIYCCEGCRELSETGLSKLYDPLEKRWWNVCRTCFRLLRLLRGFEDEFDLGG